MKMTLLLVALLLGQSVLAQTMREKRIKAEMLERTELLIETIATAREDLKNEDVTRACERINDLFILYPEHLKAIGTHLNLFQSKTVNVKNLIRDQLIFIHRKKLLCAEGYNSEFIDPRDLSKRLKKIEKSLKKQKKIIKKADTSYNNSFYYYYEF